MKSAIPLPLSTGLNANKRKTPSSPIQPTKRIVSNPLAASTNAAGRKGVGFVPTTTRKPASTSTASSTLGVGAARARPGSALNVSQRRTASSGSMGSSSAAGASANSSTSSTTVNGRTRPTGIAATRRPPVTSSGTAGVRAGAGTLGRSTLGRGVSPGAAAGLGGPGAGGSAIGSGLASSAQLKVS